MLYGVKITQTDIGTTIEIPECRVEDLITILQPSEECDDCDECEDEDCDCEECENFKDILLDAELNEALHNSDTDTTTRDMYGLIYRTGVEHGRNAR